jgi:hypothetical protein
LNVVVERSVAFANPPPEGGNEGGWNEGIFEYKSSRAVGIVPQSKAEIRIKIDFFMF